MAEAFVRWLWWRTTDLVAFVYRLLVRAKHDHILECRNIEVPVRVYTVSGKLIPKWASGVTIGRNIFVLKGNETNVVILAHELTHVIQGQNCTFLFALDYLVQALTKGYKNISYEQEAYEVSWRVQDGGDFPCT